MKIQHRLLEKNLLPDFLIRPAIRALLKKKLKQEARGGGEGEQKRAADFLAKVKKSPISAHADAANSQHYELPAEFFEKMIRVFE